MWQHCTNKFIIVGHLTVWISSPIQMKDGDRMVVGFITTYAISDYHH